MSLPTFRRLLRVLFLTVFAAAGTFACAADKVALVIGNSAYPDKPLANPANDAADVAEALRKLGFDVIETADLDKRGIERRSREFRTKLQSASLALLYYAGHGLQIEGRNYILPVDAKIESAEDVKLEAVDLDAIMQQMRGAERVSIIIMDACRDNPFAKTLAGPATRASRNAFGGLAEVKSSVGSVIVFATDPGNVASDGDGRNSPFSAALLRNMHEPNIDFSRLMMKVRYDVIRATQGKQVPWESTSLIMPVYLAGEPGGQPAQQASLATGNGAQARSLAHTRESGPQPAPAPRPAPPPEDFGLMCDRLTSSQQDPLRRRDVPIVRVVDHERAIPACEKAVAAAPAALRYANQLGRAYLAAKREEDAARIYQEAAERGSAYATAEMGFLHFRGWGGIKRDYVAAKLWSEKAARLGVPVAMTNVAYMLGRGLGGPRDLAQARQWYQRAMALNDPQALIEVSYAWRNGQMGETDDAKSLDFMRKAAATDEPDAIAGLAIFYQQGIGVPKDFEEARKLYERAAAAGNALAMAQIGFLFRNGEAGFPRDYKLAREWFSRAAKLNHPTGLAGLALMYAYGEGVEKDLVEARKYIEAAARHDDFGAIRLLADWLDEGFFGASDREAARAWLQRAADQDDDESKERLARFDRPETPGDACDRLAARDTDPLRPANVKAPNWVNSQKALPVCEAAAKEKPETLRYLNQLGYVYVDLNRYADALRAFEQAAERGSAYAAVWVGNIHSRGLGVPKNLALGTQWYQKSAAGGSINGVYNLAYAYERGDGTAIDHDLARQWYVKAAAMGSGDAMRQLGRMYYLGTGLRRDYTVARLWYERAAAKGDADSMRVLGEIYERGYGIEKNMRLARQWYAQAAAANDTTAMQRLAQLYISGFGGAKELQKARGLLEQAAGADVAQAMVTLAQAHLARVFGDVDEGEARKWLEKAAGMGNAVAKSMLSGRGDEAGGADSPGETCDRAAGSPDDPMRSVAVPVPARVDTARGIPACEQALAASPRIIRYANQLGLAYVVAARNFDAMRVFRQAAEKGSPFAILWVGNLYGRGLGVPKDSAQAALWYEKAAEHGYASAMHNLGVHYLALYRTGPEGEKLKNAGLARAWYEKAAALGSAGSMRDIAYLYERGMGVSADVPKAIEWMEKAADFGSDSARNDLAVRYIRGDGVPMDHARARELLEQAHANGLIQANLNLAHLLIFGEGVEHDKPRARKLLESSAERQNVNSVVYLAEALNAGTFGPPETEEARRLLRLAADLGSARAKTLLEKMK